MKTTTSKTLIASATLILAFIITSSFGTGVTGQKYATMTVRESIAGIPDGGYDSKILIVYEDNKNEEVSLEKLKASTYAANRTKINETLNSMATKGYELVSIDNQSYVFIKK